MERTPEKWFELLATRLDARQPRVKMCRQYVDGNAPLPEMGENLRASWEAFQKKARRNLGGLAVGSLADRCVPNGVRIGAVGDSVELDEARRIWRDNGLDIVFADAIDDYLTTGVGYIAIGLGSSGDVVVTREMPEQMIADQDPTRPWKARAVLKVWRDEESRLDYAKLWLTGQWMRFVRRSTTLTGTYMQNAWVPGATGEDAWQLLDEGEYEGDPPISILSRKGGAGILESNHDAIDAINLGKLNRLVITAMQAFRQRALKKDPKAADLDDKDVDGNDIDFRKVFEPAPGALWDLPEGFDIWESQATDIRPLLEGEKTDARDFAALTRTPISVFIPDGANQSAEGAASAKESQISQAKAEIKRMSPSLDVALASLLAVTGPSRLLAVAGLPARQRQVA